MPSWLDGIRAKVLGTPPGVYLGAFGKHPGWDDHVEPIGLDSEPLVAAREVLYIKGIGGVVDTALWEKNPEDVLPQIGHFFCWTNETDTLLGRMWSSTDGKGRAKYPLAALAHIGLPFSYALASRTARVLQEVESRCRQATTAPEVRETFATGLLELRNTLAQPPDGLGAEPDRETCSRVAQRMGLAEDSAFLRSLYALQEKARSAAVGPKSSNKIGLKMVIEDTDASQIRLPMTEDASVEGIAFWHKVIAEFSPVKKPLLYLHPLGCRWVDVILGTPSPRQLYALRANQKALPLASAVPYELDPAFRESATAAITKICDLNTVATKGAASPPPLPA